MSKNIQIKSRHATLTEAVNAAGIDLSYNPQAAAAKIKDLERGFRGAKAGEAFVTPEGVYYILNCDIRLLNKFEPFSAVMDDCPFRVCVLQENNIHISDATISKTPELRKVIAKSGALVH